MKPYLSFNIQAFYKLFINVLFNDALNTFYLRLYGVRHMVKDHSDSEKGNPLPPHRPLLSINSKGSFICTIPDRITHTTAFVTPVVEHWLEREIHLSENIWVIDVNIYALNVIFYKKNSVVRRYTFNKMYCLWLHVFTNTWTWKVWRSFTISYYQS